MTDVKFRILSLEEMLELEENTSVHLHMYSDDGRKIIECDLEWGKSTALNNLEYRITWEVYLIIPS